MSDKIKNLGQVFTPNNIVKDMLGLIDYTGNKILKKHVIDNSCGDGAFLVNIVKTYIYEYKREYGTVNGVNKHLEKYIHGIEIDKEIYSKCLENLNNIALAEGVTKVEWDIINTDAIECNIFDNKMDYVIGNPPYVRTHNLGENCDKIRRFEFCKKGMTDLYILFYEIGFKMLKKTGVLCYITPNSFYTSNAGVEFRKHILKNKKLVLVADLGHYQPFNVASYTAICKFDNGIASDTFDFYKYNDKGECFFQETINIQEAFNDGKMVLAKKEEQDLVVKIQNYKAKNANLLRVKNGFATLADKVFISKEVKADSIRVIKASTGEWYNCIFPYDINCQIIDFSELENSTKRYLSDNKKVLTSRSLEKDAKWYGFGRSQAIKDVYKSKIAINTTIKDVKSIRINQVRSGEGVYSGLYILGDFTVNQIKKYLENEDFINYLTLLRKYKNGGYYTFSSKDLEKYLIYKMENDNE